MRVVIYNAHFGDMPRAYSDRAAMCVEMLAAMPGIATSIVMVQEAGPSLARRARTRILTHEAYFSGTRPGLLTLVPHTAAELDGARVKQYALPSAMRRTFHVVHVGTLALVNVHLESCAVHGPTRARQVERIRETCSGHRLVILGDLNGYDGKWDSFVADNDVHVTETKRRVFSDISLHARATFEVR